MTGGRSSRHWLERGEKRVDELLKLLVIAFGVCLGRWIAKKWDK